MKLHDILSTGDTYGITIGCARCGRGVSMTVGMMIAMLGADCEEPRAAARFTCGGCGRPATDFTWVFRPRKPVDWKSLRFGTTE